MSSLWFIFRQYWFPWRQNSWNREVRLDFPAL
jgi:hypothetical protein